MIGRVFMVAACAAAGWAQLPPPQAAPPPPDDARAARKRADERRSESRLDAVVYDLQGQPVADLKAEDFSLTVSGKPQKIKTASYLTEQPLRLVVVLDDLGLSRENSNAARAALRRFLDQLAPGDEMAILRAGSGSSARDRLTADKQELLAAIDNAPFNPMSEGAPPETVAGALRTVVRGVVDGLREMPGRKAVLFVSEHIRNAATAMVRNVKVARSSMIPTNTFAIMMKERCVTTSEPDSKR